MLGDPATDIASNRYCRLTDTDVTMPTALIQPRQFGWQSTQLNCIGSLRSSRVSPAFAKPPSMATRPGGVAAFKGVVAAFLDHTLAQKYNGVAAPRLVMFSPIAHEDLARPHWPDGKAHNANLAPWRKRLIVELRNRPEGFTDGKQLIPGRPYVPVIPQR